MAASGRQHRAGEGQGDMSSCTTLACGGTGLIPGVYGADVDIPQRATYCRACATYLWADGSFTPDNEELLVDRAPPLTDGERAAVERFEAAPAAPESFDARAALLRVQGLAELWTRAGMGPVLQGAGQTVLDTIRGES